MSERVRTIAPALIALTSMIIIGNILHVPVQGYLVLFLVSLVISFTLLNWRKRVGIGLIAIAVLMFIGIYDIYSFLKYAHLNIVLFILGMMIIVGYLEENNFFLYIISKFLPLMYGSGFKLLSIMMILGAFFSAIVDEVTAILFMASITLELAAIFKVKPQPLVLAVTFSVIIGGTATVMGDPVAIIIALSGGLTMSEFLFWATPLTILNLGILIAIISLERRNDLRHITQVMREVEMDEVKRLLESEEVTNLRFSSFILISVLAIIIFHSQIAELIIHHIDFHISPQELGENILIATPLLFSGLIFLYDPEGGSSVLTHRVDWNTIIFLMMFFSVVGSLEVSGVLDRIIDIVLSVSGSDPRRVYFIMSGITAILSPIMDNVLTVATLAPIVKDIGSRGINIYPTWWGMLFAGVFPALTTPIGTSASLVMTGILEKHRVKPIKTKEWIRAGLPSALTTTIVAILIIYIRSFLI